MARRKSLRGRTLIGVVCSAVCSMSLISVAGAHASVAKASPAPSSTVPVYLNTHYSFAERAADLVSRMTLADKGQQLHNNNAPTLPRLGWLQDNYFSGR